VGRGPGGLKGGGAPHTHWQNALREFFISARALIKRCPFAPTPLQSRLPLAHTQSSARTLLISSNQLTLNICFIPLPHPAGVFILVLFFFFLPSLEFARCRCFFYARVVIAVVVCALIYLRLVLFQGEICANKNCRKNIERKLPRILAEGGRL